MRERNPNPIHRMAQTRMSVRRIVRSKIYGPVSLGLVSRVWFAKLMPDHHAATRTGAGSCWTSRSRMRLWKSRRLVLGADEGENSSGEVMVRAFSRDAMVIGNLVGGARITIRDVTTGTVLAEGIQKGGAGSGNTLGGAIRRVDFAAALPVLSTTREIDQRGEPASESLSPEYLDNVCQ